MESATTKRDPYIDIIKGIGILSIVAGHSGGTIGLIRLNLSAFVYLYHIMIFFFIAGFCFKKEHGLRPYLYIGKRLGSVLPLFAAYSVFFVLLHNPLFRLGFFDESQHMYSRAEMVSYCLNAFVFQHIDILLGAFWFIPMYIAAVGFFGVLFSVAERTGYPRFFHVLFAVLSGGLGVYAQNLSLAWHIQTSVLAVPVVYGGYAVRKHWDCIKRFIPSWGFAAAGCILYWIVTRPVGFVELSLNQIISPWLFYPITAVGVYFCMSLGKFLGRRNLSGRLFSCIGKNSYHIMALHFFAFKIVDMVYGTLTQKEASVICIFPHAFDYLWPVYDFFGIVMPLIFVGVIRLGVKCFNTLLSWAASAKS